MSIIGIIGAMDEEIAALKARMEGLSTSSVVGCDYHMGTMRGKSVVLVCSGIGKVNAAVCAQALIDRFAADFVVNVGVAGALAEGLKIGDVVISGSAVQYDFDCTAFGHELGVIPRMATSEFRGDDKLIKLALDAARGLAPEKTAIVGRVASGDKFVSDGETKQWLKTAFEADCCEMEGAAIAHACRLNRVPFVVIRVMSDSADAEADASFDEYVVESADFAGAIVDKIVENL